jgi:uncharacterized protein (DUF885 family)
MRRSKLLLTLAACAAVTILLAGPPPGPAFSKFVDDYFAARYDFSPVEGTAAGFHQYDSRIDDLSSAAVLKRITTLKQQQSRLAGLRSSALSPADEIDAQVLDGEIRSELLDLDTLKLWRTNPMGYVAIPGGAVDGLMKRNFAPAPERLRSIVARLKGVPPLVAAMRANVENPPKEFTDLAIIIASGSAGFFRGAVVEWGRNVGGSDAALRAEFERANSAAAAAMESAAAWLKSDLLPRSKGAYAIGAANFSKKLLYDEMVDIPLDRLLAIGEANLEKDRQAFIETARRIDPKKSPLEVINSLSADHPTAANLVPYTQETIEGIRRFVVDRHIVTIPSEVRPIIKETPPFARAGSFASMDTPGAYETRATEAYYYVTPPEADWTAAQKEEHLRAFNRGGLILTTIHEAFPGHYVQFLYSKQFPTKTRKLVFCGSNAEGWAHYTEQMMVEQGFGNGDLKIRLAQLHEALLRDCRYVVGIKLHTAGMTVAEGAKVFEQRGYREPQVGFEEARRGAYNPTYLYYTVGKLEIYKLRADCQRARGAAFTIEQFHDDFVRQGGIPIPLVRRILLPGENAPAL